MEINTDFNKTSYIGLRNYEIPFSRRVFKEIKKAVSSCRRYIIIFQGFPMKLLPTHTKELVSLVNRFTCTPISLFNGTCTYSVVVVCTAMLHIQGSSS